MTQAPMRVVVLATLSGVYMEDGAPVALYCAMNNDGSEAPESKYSPPQE
jgi:uncharacterized protein YigE (DUF2233 family)